MNEYVSDLIATGMSESLPSAEPSRWYVVQTQAHNEIRAMANLERQGIVPFCPWVAKTVRHARKVTQTKAALFPGYLFVELDLECDRWRHINGTRGVIRILTQGEKPVAVPPGIVEQIKIRIDADGVIGWASPFSCGQKVRITEGPFADFVGRIEHLDAAGRVRVLLDLMGRAVTVQTKTDTLSADL